MRATIVAPAAPSRDATGAYVVAVARCLVGAGWDVQVLVEQVADVPLDVLPAVRLVPRLCDDGRPQDAAVAEHLERSAIAWFVYPGWSPLHEMLQVPVAGARVLAFLGVTPPRLWTGPGRDALDRGVARLPQAAARADVLVAHSESLRAELAAAAGMEPQRVSVLRLPVDTQRFTQSRREAPRAAAAGPRLLYVGRMASSKRIDLLVDVLARVRAAGAAATLVLAGDGETEPYRRHLADAMSAARRAGCENSVEYLGMVADGDLPGLYASADVYVSASEHEGIGVPLVEAMAAGVPVVAASAAAVPETVGDAGLLVPAGDAAALADAVLSVLRDGPLRERLVRLGREQADLFSPERFRTALVALTQRLAGGPTAAAGRVALRVDAAAIEGEPLAPFAVAVSAANDGAEDLPADFAVRLDWALPDGTPLVLGAATARFAGGVGRGMTATARTVLRLPASPGRYVLEARAGESSARRCVTVEGAAWSDPEEGRRAAQIEAAARFAPDYRDASHRTGLWRIAVRVRAAMTRHLARTHVDVIARRHAAVQAALASEIESLRAELRADRAAREAEVAALSARIAALEAGLAAERIRAGAEEP